MSRRSDLGQAGTRAARTSGGHAFGGRALDIAAKLHSARRRMLVSQLQESCTDQSSRVFALAAQTSALGVSIPDALAMARMLQRAEAHREIEIADQEDAVVAEWMETQGQAICRGVKRALPALAQVPLEAVPTPCGVQVRAQATSAADIGDAVSWATDNSHYSGLSSHLQKHLGLVAPDIDVSGLPADW